MTFFGEARNVFFARPTMANVVITEAVMMRPTLRVGSPRTLPSVVDMATRTTKSKEIYIYDEFKKQT